MSIINAGVKNRPVVFHSDNDRASDQISQKYTSFTRRDHDGNSMTNKIKILKSLKFSPPFDVKFLFSIFQRLKNKKSENVGSVRSFNLPLNSSFSNGRHNIRIMLEKLECHRNIQFSQTFTGYRIFPNSRIPNLLGSSH